MSHPIMLNRADGDISPDEASIALRLKISSDVLGTGAPECQQFVFGKACPCCAPIGMLGARSSKISELLLGAMGEVCSRPMECLII